MEYGLFMESIVPIWGSDSEREIIDEKELSTIADEGLYGMGVKILKESKDYLYIQTHYGYLGYVHSTQVLRVDEETIKEWDKKANMIVVALAADVTTLPQVQGVIVKTLFRGSPVIVLDFESIKGWAKVQLVDGSIGYMRNIFLREKKYSQSFLWTGSLPQEKVDEAAFRENICRDALTYLNIQYRWAGKTVLGLDCSGLTSLSYMLQGILIYRDASIEEGYPVKEKELKDILPGDLLYFPGHIALYLGEGKYVHSTGHEESGGVVVNSLYEEDEEYRDDLFQAITAVGTIF